MIIDAISDLHGYKCDLEGGDLLVVAGDLCARDCLREHLEILDWLDRQKYRKKIVVAGNHDNFLKNTPDFYYGSDITYLCDSGIEFEGLKIWGSPWSVWFNGVHPSCAAFMEPESKLATHFANMPSDCDILITHTPPYKVLDSNFDGLTCGSMSLSYILDTKVSPKVHIFGHIHEHGGNNVTINNIRSYNVSIVDENYKLRRGATRIEV